MLSSWIEAGFSPFITSCSSESLQRMMSMRSPRSSSITALMREPRTPTHAPMQSIFGSCAIPAIFVRAADDDAHARAVLAHLDDDRSDPVAGRKRLAAHALLLGKVGLDLAEVD